MALFVISNYTGMLYIRDYMGLLYITDYMELFYIRGRLIVFYITEYMELASSQTTRDWSRSHDTAGYST